MRPALFAAILCIAIFIGATTLEPPTAAPLKAVNIKPDSIAAVYFFNSNQCQRCHGSDPNQRVLITESGEDVNPIDDWAGSMMAHSTIDPFWRAKVQEELNLAGSHKKVIERTCLNCHAPMAMYQKLYTTGDTLSFSDIFHDTLALEGVSCVACHGLEDKELFDIPGGEIHYNRDSMIYGPYPNPYGVTMQQYTGLEPVHSPHITSSGICAKCHTLITPVPDSDKGFVEQAVYQEWLNSSYNVERVRCQDCHMPAAESPVVISSGVNGLDPRSPYAEHRLAGGNLFMLNLLRNNHADLGLKTTYSQLDSAIKYNTQMLRHNSLRLELSQAIGSEDSLYFNLSLTNLSGHKLPSGYPSRRVFIQFAVINTLTGDTLFQSGSTDQKGHLLHADESVQPHYRYINDATQTQIYEMIPADKNGVPTTVLTQAAIQLKDNRLVPAGWQNEHFTKDTTSIVGAALTDPDFNRTTAGEEGSGTDMIQYRLPKPAMGTLKIVAQAWYQAIPRKWVNNLHGSDSLITIFQSMYHNEASTIELLASDSIINYRVATKINLVARPLVYPSLLTGGSEVYFDFQGSATIDVTVFSPAGQPILTAKNFKGSSLKLPPLPQGFYFIQVRNQRGLFTYPVQIYQ